jgi:hypothetical protein
MEEQQIQREVAPADLHRVLATDEAEVTAQFDQEIIQPQQQTAMQVGLRMSLWQAEKFKQVAVLEDAGGTRMSV